MGEGTINGEGWDSTTTGLPKGGIVIPLSDGSVLIDSPLKTRRKLKPKDLTTSKGRIASASLALMSEKKVVGSIDFLASNFAEGVEGFFAYARHCTDTRIQRIVAMWDDLSETAKKETSILAMCREVGLDQFEFGGFVTATAMKYSKLEGALIASQFIPKVMLANATEATKPEGIADRKMFMESTGLLPTNKGVSINQQFNVNASADGPPDFSSNIVDGAAALRFNENKIIDVDELNGD